MVNSFVDPPAPHVTSTKRGCSAVILSIRKYKFSVPASVLGGKNSKEKKGADVDRWDTGGIGSVEEKSVWYGLVSPAFPESTKLANSKF